MKTSHRPSPPPPPSQRTSKGEKAHYFAEIAILLFIGFFAYYHVIFFYQSSDTTVKWDELRAINNDHALMVDSYVDCRRKIFSDSKSECHLVALNYGRELKLNNSEEIFNKIVAASQ